MKFWFRLIVVLLFAVAVIVFVYPHGVYADKYNPYQDMYEKDQKRINEWYDRFRDERILKDAIKFPTVSSTGKTYKVEVITDEIYYDPVSNALPWMVAVDGENNIYWIVCKYHQEKNWGSYYEYRFEIRRYDSKTGGISTIDLDDRFTVTRTYANGERKDYPWRSADFQRLVYNPEDGCIYASVSYHLQNSNLFRQSYTDGRKDTTSTIWKVYPEIELVSYEASHPKGEVFYYIFSDDLMVFDEDNNLWFSNKFGNTDSIRQIMRVKGLDKRKQAERLIIFDSRDEKSLFSHQANSLNAVIKKDAIYLLFDSPVFSYMYKVNRTANGGIEKDLNKWEIKHVWPFSCKATHKGKFYFVNDDTVYSMTPEGKVKVVLAPGDTNGQIHKIAAITFDQDDNLILMNYTEGEANWRSVRNYRLPVDKINLIKVSLGDE